MSDSFQQVEKLPGTVYVDDEVLGECRYEFVYDPYDTNSMEITLLGPPRSMPSAPGMLPVKVVTDFLGALRDEAGPRSSGWATFNMKESRNMAPVKEFKKEQRFEEEVEPREIGIGFLFPITSVTETAVPPIPSRIHGFVRGRYDRQAQVFEPADNTFSIGLPLR